MNEEQVKKFKKNLYRYAAKTAPGNKARQNKIIFGALRKTGWKPKRERQA